ncbi:glycosyl transferase group 1 [Photobacterium aphoticum]|uniref:Glycosyl transferase group 1 n=1 Tax=Photobacterium aphoticum TaxID=754436 RepID=A0A090R0R1_9GAMM|nr:glycosyl transferase group 1 [Photobacterium aphoticum]
MHQDKIIGILTGGLMGSDPYHPSSWSGSSASFFHELNRQQRLAYAFGPELSRWYYYRRFAGCLHYNKEVWKRKLYMSKAYRDDLTDKARQLAHLHQIQHAQSASPPGHAVVQLGAYMNAREIYGNKMPIFSYQDGNIAERQTSSFTPKALRAQKTLFAEAIAYEKKVAHDMDLIFTTSEYLRQSFIDHYQLPPARVVNIDMGTNLSPFEHITSQQKDYRRKDILFIGKSDFLRKGTDLAIQAFEIVQQTYPQAILHLVGPEVKHQRRYPNPNIHFHGLLSKNNPQHIKTLESLFQHCAIYIQPSRYEPFGIAPIEAMMHGIPAVVTGEWALKESVIDGVTGAHAKLNDAQDLASKMLQLLQNPQLAQMGAQAQEWAKGHFSWEKTVSSLLAHIDNHPPKAALHAKPVRDTKSSAQKVSHEVSR